MADLTILAPLPLIPLHPSLESSRPSLFRNYVPGASSSRVHLSSPSSSPIPIPTTSPRSRSRSTTRNGSSDTEATDDTDTDSHGSHNQRQSQRQSDHDGVVSLVDGDSSSSSLAWGKDAQVEVGSPTSYTSNNSNAHAPNWDIGYRPTRVSGGNSTIGMDSSGPHSQPHSHFHTFQSTPTLTSASASHTRTDLSTTSPSPSLRPLIIRGRTPTQRHRPTRSRSAPPSPLKSPLSDLESDGGSGGRSPSPSRTSVPNAPFSAGIDGYGYPRRSYTSYTPSTVSSPTGSVSSYSPWIHGQGMSTPATKTKGGELLRPPPPLHRPTTFWRHTPRSGVTSSSFSPSTHVVRRSTFVAAGIPFEKPTYDMSALGVECRVRTAIKEEGGSKEVSTVFWEVVMER